MSEAAVVDRYLNRRQRGRDREILTPEGVPLRFSVALAGERVWGVFLDYLLLLAMAITAAFFLYLLHEGGLSNGFVSAILLVLIFLLRNFYFIWFEIRWHGATPGKRRAGTRVIDRRGGTLTPGAVFVRNITREFELFIPFLVICEPEQLLPGAEGWAVLLAVAWVLVLAFFPLLNRDRLRIGDLFSGTLVVLAPKAVLERDLTRRPTKDRAESPAHTFTREQLGIYGVFELQVLEDLLRSRSGESREALEAVAEKIRKKIGWESSGERTDPRRFLSDFYAAQRARLEKDMLLGERREKKRE